MLWEDHDSIEHRNKEEKKEEAKEHHLDEDALIPHGVAPYRACRPWIFFINGVLCFFKINGSGMEKEER